VERCGFALDCRISLTFVKVEQGGKVGECGILAGPMVRGSHGGPWSWLTFRLWVLAVLISRKLKQKKEKEVFFVARLVQTAVSSANNLVAKTGKSL
jgi:hypothetical protein